MSSSKKRKYDQTENKQKWYQEGVNEPCVWNLKLSARISDEEGVNVNCYVSIDDVRIERERRVLHFDTSQATTRYHYALYGRRPWKWRTSPTHHCMLRALGMKSRPNEGYDEPRKSGTWCLFYPYCPQTDTTLSAHDVRQSSLRNSFLVGVHPALVPSHLEKGALNIPAVFSVGSFLDDKKHGPWERYEKMCQMKPVAIDWFDHGKFVQPQEMEQSLLVRILSATELPRVLVSMIVGYLVLSDPTDAYPFAYRLLQAADELFVPLYPRSDISYQSFIGSRMNDCEDDLTTRLLIMVFTIKRPYDDDYGTKYMIVNITLGYTFGVIIGWTDHKGKWIRNEKHWKIDYLNGRRVDMLLETDLSQLESDVNCVLTKIHYLWRGYLDVLHTKAIPGKRPMWWHEEWQPEHWDKRNY